MASGKWQVPVASGKWLDGLPLDSPPSSHHRMSQPWHFRRLLNTGAMISMLHCSTEWQGVGIPYSPISLIHTHVLTSLNDLSLSQCIVSPSNSFGPNVHLQYPLTSFSQIIRFPIALEAPLRPDVDVAFGWIAMRVSARISGCLACQSLPCVGACASVSQTCKHANMQTCKHANMQTC